MFDFVDIEFMSDLLKLGSLGFVGGVLFPLAFRLVGYVIETVYFVLK